MEVPLKIILQVLFTVVENFRDYAALSHFTCDIPGLLCIRFKGLNQFVAVTTCYLQMNICILNKAWFYR